jgi:hypothetical protein
LFRDLARVFEGQEPENPPLLGEIRDVMLEHAALLTSWFGERAAMRSFRRHSTWYTKGFRGSAELRQRLMQIATLEELKLALAPIDAAQPFPASAMRVPRGKASGTQSVSLPENYLLDRDDATPPGADAEDEFSGG